ncbi:hypothetical protein ACRERI_00355 [Methanothermobacter thermautotrophicus]|uniref:hypothetical protein n=1 Tax=Methanothermobacter thermautotrophicus TaxID=145262 RepID=UPI003D7FCC6A
MFDPFLGYSGRGDEIGGCYLEARNALNLFILVLACWFVVGFNAPQIYGIERRSTPTRSIITKSVSSTPFSSPLNTFFDRK